MKSLIITFATCFLLIPDLIGQTTFNGGFEVWGTTNPFSFEDPENWVTTNILCESLGLPPNVILSEDACTGSFAMRLETGTDSLGMPFPAMAALKNEITGRPEKLTGYYKADFKGDDYASVRVKLTSDRGMVGWGVIDIGYPTYNFIYFEIPIQYISHTIKPDSFNITIYSSVDRAVTGSTITFDDLAFEENIDVTIPLVDRYVTRVWPNPAIDELRFEIHDDLGLMTLRLYNESGVTMEQEKFENETRIDVSRFTDGLYYYEIRYANHELYDRGHFKVMKSRTQ
jgi:hypothetical protein